MTAPTYGRPTESELGPPTAKRPLCWVGVYRHHLVRPWWATSDDDAIDVRACGRCGSLRYWVLDKDGGRYVMRWRERIARGG